MFRAMTWGVAAAMAMTATAVQANILTFNATLEATAPTETGSAATGRMRMHVDTVRQRVSVDLDVKGIPLDALSDALVAKPIGPVHFHKYMSEHHHGDVVLVLPVPYGPAYKATPKGFHVAMRDYDYAAGAKLLGSDLDFGGFVAALRSGQVILNIHTDRFGDGEISGTVKG